MKAFSVLGLTVTLAGLFGCQSNTTNSNASIYKGSSVTVGSGTAYTWVKTNSSGNFSSIGITLSDSALTGLEKMEEMLELPVPSGFSTPFKSVALDYANTDPIPYNKPHIDPHFFYIDMAHRMSIMADTDSMMPINMTMPAGYMTDSISEAMMGVHWTDTTGPENHGQPFQSAVGYGFTNGNLTFMEVMCDKTSLEVRKTITNTVRKPTMMGGTMGSMMMSIPSSYQLSYDSIAHAYSIEFDGF